MAEILREPASKSQPINRCWIREKKVFLTWILTHIKKGISPFGLTPWICWLAQLDNCKNLTDSFVCDSNPLKSKPLSKPQKKKHIKPPHAIFLAQRFQKLLRSDSVNNQAELARIHGITRARVTQIMNLLKLSGKIRTELLQMPPDEQEYFSERKLREIVKLQYASQQLEAFEKLKSKYNG